MKRAGVSLVFMIINAAVFVAWKFGDDELKFNLSQHILTSYDALLAGYYSTLIGSVFAHFQSFHFLINMMVLRSFGPIMEDTLGHRRFAFFYLIAGIVSSLSHCLVSAYVINDPSVPALGASGALAGLILLFSLLFPKEKLLFLGFIPIRAIWGAVMFIGLDLWGLWAQKGGGGFDIGHGAHLGGAFTGIAYYLFLRKNYRIVSAE